MEKRRISGVFIGHVVQKRVDSGATQNASTRNRLKLGRFHPVTLDRPSGDDREMGLEGRGMGRLHAVPFFSLSN